MPTLVTGGAGFIGYHVTKELLSCGDSVVSIDSLHPYYDVRLKQARIADLRAASRDFKFAVVDFAKSDDLASSLEGIEISRIVHLGAQAGVRYSISHPEVYGQSNLVGHLNILELARRRSVDHLIYASSSSVYGSNRPPFSVEDQANNPLSLYAATKRSNELLSESFSHLYRIPMTGLRFFTVYGPWGRPDMAVWLFTKKILTGQPVQLFNGGDMRRDFTYIDDIVKGILLCAKSPPLDDGLVKAGGSTSPHCLYNIGNNRAEPLKKVITILEQACGRRADIELHPMQKGDVYETFADIGPIKEEHGFVPLTSIEDGLPRFVEWYKSYAASALAS